ncbi:hypothetical protein MNBD_GAMMA12-2438 [hydrothermal vent metagenome]|uniref:Integral membrane protein CcmA involved in cell shape determination n=1 Tax=hydrothermal vent metagenome TaxID=652676 RepID=A0A3B0YKX5_9ZZZZ
MSTQTKDDENKRRVSDLQPNFSTVLGAASQFKGKISGEGDYVIYGSVDGESDIRGTLILQSTGYWRGQILATNLIVSGTVDGDIIARNRIELTSTAKVSGNIIGAIVAIADNAEFTGEVHITKNDGLTIFNERRSEGVASES